MDCCDVRLECATLSECPFAHRASVRSQAGVNAPVFGEVTALSEFGTATSGPTPKWAFPRVGAHVNGEILQLAACLVALATRVESTTVDRLGVSAQIALPFECRRAFSTRKSTSTAVRDHVGGELTGQSEFHCALSVLHWRWSTAFANALRGIYLPSRCSRRGGPSRLLRCHHSGTVAGIVANRSGVQTLIVSAVGILLVIRSDVMAACVVGSVILTATL